MNSKTGRTPELLPHPGYDAMRPFVDRPALSVRLAQAILGLAESAEIDVAHAIFVTAAISTDRLAELAGSEAKSVARMIELFRLRGLIEKRRERFIIRQPDKLRGIIENSA